jgi:hypothetical protein
MSCWLFINVPHVRQTTTDRFECNLSHLIVLFIDKTVQIVSGSNFLCEVCGNEETLLYFEFQCPECSASNDAPTSLGASGVVCEADCP